jgi:hypothetical protein
MDPSKKSTKVIEKKVRKKRVITENDDWTKTIADFQDISLFQLFEILENTPEKVKLVRSHILSKIRGYASQDKGKNILEENKFINYQEVLDLLKSSGFQCYYCKDNIIMLYEYVREPKQWTLERKNNDYGHNRDNVVLACLSCNLKRRCMKMERYELTKQMAVVEKLGS